MKYADCSVCSNTDSKQSAGKTKSAARSVKATADWTKRAQHASLRAKPSMNAALPKSTRTRFRYPSMTVVFKTKT